MNPVQYKGAADLIGEAWTALTGDDSSTAPRSDLGGLAVTGAEGDLTSHFRAADIAIACVGTALLASNALAGRPDAKSTEPHLSVDRAHVAVAMTSERHFSRRGHSAGSGFAPLSRFWRTADGWVRTHANYPWHKAALLSALDVGDDPDEIASALLSLASEDIEEQVFAAGGVATAVRPVDSWLLHPQGIAVATEPLISHSMVGDAAPRSPESGSRPGEGIRVLDLTRVIAGPVCTRYLGALGADVLRIDPPGHLDMKPGVRADTLFAKRSAGLDLEQTADIATLHELLDQADVMVCGYRPGSLDRFDLAAEQVADRHPGLVVVYLSAWGHSGPWATRRGFDSVVQAPTGIALGESDDGETPGVLPCQLLDHGTGFLAAAAVMDGLRRQRIVGGTHFRRLSLARTAKWLTSTSADKSVATTGVGNDISRWLSECGTGADAATAVTPPGSIAGKALRWPGPPTKYLSDPPAFRTS